MAERSLPTPEFRGFIHVIGKIYLPIVQSKYRRDKNKEKEARNGPYFKKWKGY